MNAKDTNGATPRVLAQVRQVRTALTQVYGDLLDVGDLAPYSGEDYTNRLLSRALTAQAVRIVTGFNPEEAAATVIDGHADQGIDAIAVVDGPNPHVYLVQGKWSPQGKAAADRKAVLELLAGLRLIDDEDFAPFNPVAGSLPSTPSPSWTVGPCRSLRSSS